MAHSLDLFVEQDRKREAGQVGNEGKETKKERKKKKKSFTKGGKQDRKSEQGNKVMKKENVPKGKKGV